MGNVLNHFRRNRKTRIAWSDSTSDDSSAKELAKIEGDKPKPTQEFPTRMALEPIDLELGVVCQPQQQPREEINDENVIEVARKWRRRIQLTRERIKSADIARMSSIESDD